MAAGAVFDREDASRRFRVVTSRFGLVLSLVALAQWASGTRLLYGLIAPLESDGSIHTFGPFVNRNHYAGYMLMVVPLAVGLAAQAFRRYSRRVGGRANLRRLLVGLGSPEGTTLIYAQLAVLATVAALIATMSRGASLAFVGGMAVAVLATRRKARTVFLIAPVVAVALALSWAGTARIGARFGSTPSDASGRTVIWRTTLAKMRGLWYTGSGFNTFGTAVSRITAWALPKGATPWREPYETTVALAPRMGFLSPESGTGLGWFREAHNDYLQILLETGLPGLCITLAAAFALLRRTRADPWLLAAVVGVMLHSFVEFDLQIPAVATLFVTVAALRPRSRFATSSQFVSEGDSVHSHPAEYV